MSLYIHLPILWLTFWYIRAPKSILSTFASFNKSCLQMLSLPLLFKTYFKPWKNEYRKGLVGFSRAMGIFIKTFFIAAELVIMALVLAFEVCFFVFFLLWPIATVLLLFRV